MGTIEIREDIVELTGRIVAVETKVDRLESDTAKHIEKDMELFDELRKGVSDIKTALAVQKAGAAPWIKAGYAILAGLWTIIQGFIVWKLTS